MALPLQTTFVVLADDLSERPLGEESFTSFEELRDEHIRQEVRQILSGFYLDAADIAVAVAGRVVRLTGTVGDKNSKLLAEDLAATTPGVLRVESQIRVVMASGRAARRS